ncbi:hypothetical protein BH10BAC3_BH10BAC3_18700 [soil metagenome]
MQKRSSGLGRMGNCDNFDNVLMKQPNTLPANIKIKEDSVVAKLAAKKLKSDNVAIVFGTTIHLYGVTSHSFLLNDEWVKHELKHVAQFQQHGFVFFLAKYIWEWMRHGYYNNRFEIEAREAEVT